MRKYKIRFFVEKSYEEKIIECRELSIKENCYTFWIGNFGESNRLVASYPINWTIVEEIYKD